ncbi:hypothetical protein HMPREF9607_02452 [Cutibacterium modestum HL044PA1]|uniref:Uncharacterized protein n=1 Tax=Cutibacterium modestum HL044PA1 TaxID=765109 RepID=A0ABN0C231_9ACTN|nr:hypothetical protein HMPREF9607_02452 [Cutibacterium modestum HL044PA1]
MAVQPPWTLPAPIGAFLTTGGDWRAVILCLVNILISTAIYYPFMRMYDRDQLKKENCENISEWLQFMVGENMNGGVAVSDIETSFLPSSLALARLVHCYMRLLTRLGLARYRKVNNA